MEDSRWAWDSYEKHLVVLDQTMTAEERYAALKYARLIDDSAEFAHKRIHSLIDDKQRYHHGNPVLRR